MIILFPLIDFCKEPKRPVSRTDFCEEAKIDPFYHNKSNSSCLYWLLSCFIYHKLRHPLYCYGIAYQLYLAGECFPSGFLLQLPAVRERILKQDLPQYLHLYSDFILPSYG